MNRRTRHRLARAILTLLLLGHPLHADLIVLRNGQELRGRLRTAGERMRIDLDVGGTVVVDKGDIARTVVDTERATTAKQPTLSAELLKRLEARESIHVLLERLGAEKEADRLAAERQLAQVGRAALPTLRAALNHGPPARRRHVLRVLTALGDPAVLPAARAILKDPERAPHHADAARALADVGGPAVAPELTALLANSTDDAVADVCLQALVAWRAPFAAPFVIEAAQRPPLRQTAADAVARWGDPILLPYLTPRVAKATSAASQHRLATWIVGLLTPGHVPLLSKLLDEHRDRKTVAKTLADGARRLHKAFPVAGDVALLGATRPEIQKAAHESLKRLLKADHPPRPQAWQADFARVTEPRILVVPVGREPRTTAREVATYLGRVLGHPVEVDATAVPFPGSPAEPRDARRLLRTLDRRQFDDPRSVRVIGVTSLALAVSGQPQALAPTRPGGSIVLSLAHLGKGKRRADRIGRLALHALAQSFGLHTCGTPRCPSGPVYQPSDLDATQAQWCPACARTVDQLWGAEAEAARFRYAEAGQRLSRRAGKEAAAHAAAAYMYERAHDPEAAQKAWREHFALTKDAAVQALVQRRIQLLARAIPPRPADRPKRKARGK